LYEIYTNLLIGYLLTPIVFVDSTYLVVLMK